MTPLKKPVRRVTVGALDGTHGRDRGKPLVASLELGDLLTLRPAGTRRMETVSLFDVYVYAVRCRVNATQLARAREKKAQKAEQRRARKWKAELRRQLP